MSKLKIAKPTSSLDCRVCGYKGESFSVLKLKEKEYGESWAYGAILSYTINGVKYYVDTCPECGVLQRVEIDG